MNTEAMPQEVIGRVVARRGTEHPYADLDPRTSALLIVDLQNAFLIEGVAHALCRPALAILATVNRLAAAFRQTGGRVVWIQTVFREGSEGAWSVYDALVRPERAQNRRRALAPGSFGHRLHADLDVKPTDLRVEKTRYSAFIQDSSDLEARLRAVGCDTVAIVGTVTNVCCESTARDAMMRNFRTIMVSDANAAMTPREHLASLIAFYQNFGDVMDAETLIAALRANAGAPQAILSRA